MLVVLFARLHARLQSTAQPALPNQWGVLVRICAGTLAEERVPPRNMLRRGADILQLLLLLLRFDMLDPLLHLLANRIDTFQARGELNELRLHNSASVAKFRLDTRELRISVRALLPRVGRRARRTCRRG